MGTAQVTILWAGESKNLTAAASGGKIVSNTYKITTEYIYIDSGVMKTTSEQIPLWSVRDVDFKQSMMQKARGVGSITIRCQHDDFTGKASVVLEDVDGGRDLRDLINEHAQNARLEYQKRAQTQHVNYQGANAPVGVPQGVVAEDPMVRLEKLAEMREKGILTDEEFSAEKKKFLNS